MSKLLIKWNGKSGITLLELVIVCAIMGILAVICTPLILRFKEHKTVSQGIYRVYQLKKAFDSYERDCAGPPIRTNGGAFNDLKRIVDLDPPSYPLGLPEIYPDKHRCSSTSLKEYLVGNALATVCDKADGDCRQGKVAGADFSSMLAADTGGVGGIAGQCNANNIGWNYVLIEDLDAPTNKPVTVYCADVFFKPNVTVTVVVNGGGINGGTEVTDGAGMVGPSGAVLPNSCPCGAWCSINQAGGETGCCDRCTDTMGNSHSGIGFRY